MQINSWILNFSSLIEYQTLDIIINKKILAHKDRIFSGLPKKNLHSFDF
jgi:hypothetical protein